MTLGYNTEYKRYGILSGDLWVKDALYSEDDIQVRIDDNWVNTWIGTDKRITHSNGYFLNGYKDIELEYLSVRYGDECC